MRKEEEGKKENVFVPGFVSEITVMHHLYSVEGMQIRTCSFPPWSQSDLLRVGGITPKELLWMLCERLPTAQPSQPCLGPRGSAVAPVVALLSPLTL